MCADREVGVLLCGPFLARPWHAALRWSSNPTIRPGPAAKLSSAEYELSKDLCVLLQQLDTRHRANRLFDSEAVLEKEAAGLAGLIGANTRAIRALAIKVMMLLREVDVAAENLAQART